MKKLCIIPARGGSKRLPRKNIKLLNGKPLIFYTIDAVLSSNQFDKVIFTSDDDEILDKVRVNYSIDTLSVVKRPDNLTSDTSKVIDTVMYFLDKEYDQTWLTLPTSPLKIFDYDKSLPWQNGNSRSQDHPTVYRPNGALYGAWTNKLKENKNYYKGQTKGYFMPRNRSIDIDTQFEFDLAEFILNHNV
jgi:CMP-N-acetylneuraminic acid synthetase